MFGQFLISRPTDLILFIVILVLCLIAIALTRRLLHVSFPYFFMGLFGLILGLTIGGLLSLPLSKLPGEFGRWLPIIITIFTTVGLLDLFLAQTRPIATLLERLWGTAVTNAPARRADVLIDTSVLVDGRIEELINTGFLFGNLIIPQFVLQELQALADSHDSLKRSRGRRGLEVLAAIQQNNRVTCEITNDRVKKGEEVDPRLIKLARRRGLKLMTVDYNLARVAQIQGVSILNIHELAEAVKPLLIPGESLTVKVVQKGKEKGQGVGYLPDGTMIVVERGDRYVGEDVEAEVTRIFQTVAGKMIFVQPKKAATAYQRTIKSWEKDLEPRERSKDS